MVVFKSGFWETAELDGIEVGRGFSVDQEFRFEIPDGAAIRIAVLKVSGVFTKAITFTVDGNELYSGSGR